MTPRPLPNTESPSRFWRSLSGLWASLVCYSISSERDLLTLLIDNDDQRSLADTNSRLKRSLSGLWASRVCYSNSSERDLLTLLIDVDILRLFLICPTTPCLIDHKPWIGGEELFSGAPRLKDFRRFTTYVAGCDVLDNIKKTS
ncbi:hypothetical protein CDAR_66121 [Caerostris darwini]|uniref:Uncharacterized protein n=1 Tax=Caerostris darwini TaxID=1538125 RepID=A0AAV4TXC7_9ARAC|nr:hypothetical protein CDAR_66121 [Caerostris darwini]